MKSQAVWIGRLPKCPRSAYSASAPVTARNTAPSVTNPIIPWCSMKVTASHGFSASRTSGCRPIGWIAAIAITANQRHITGPKNAATLAVPRDWAANNASRMTTVSGTT